MEIDCQKLIIIGTLSSVSGVILYICAKTLTKPRSQNTKASVANKQPVNEVLFFPDKGFPCRNYLFSEFGCQKRNCKFLHSETSLSKMCSHLNRAERTVDTCLFILTNKDLADCLTSACGRGVMVRILIDATMAQTEGKRLKELSDRGVFICEAESNYLVHHKFAVVDEEILITGSYNWTAQATLGNWDNVLVTSEENLVKPYVAEFHKLWAEFSENKPRPSPPLNAAPFLKRSAWEGIIIGHKAPY